MENTTCTNNAFDTNIYYGPGARWTWNDVTHSTFAAYASAAGQDANSLVADPLLVNPAAGELHLTASSPARNAGESLPLAIIGSQDIDGDPRVAGGGVDLGADEFGEAASLAQARKTWALYR